MIKCKPVFVSNYVSEKEFVDDDWEEKSFGIDKNDFIEVEEEIKDDPK